VCSKQNPLAHFKRLQIGIFGFSQKETGANSVAMATTSRCRCVSFLVYIAGAKFEEHRFNISQVILD